MSKRYRTAFKNTVTMCFTCSFNSRLLAYKRSSYYFTRANAIHRNNKQPTNPPNTKNTNSLYNKRTTHHSIRSNKSRPKPFN